MAKEKQKVQVTMEEREERKEEKKMAKVQKEVPKEKERKAATAKKTTKAATAKLMDAKLAEKQEKQEKKQEIKLTGDQEKIAKDLLKGEFGEKAILRAQTPAMTRKGESFRLTKENLMERLSAPINKAHDWNFFTLGYHTSGGKKDSHFQRVTGHRWIDIESANLQSKNRLITFSTGSHDKHFIFILPEKGHTIKVKTLVGNDREITSDNFLDQGNYLLFSNHGRSYRVAQFLAFQYGLRYLAIPRGTYTYSNESNFQFDSLDDDGKRWVLLSRRGNAINLGDLHPLDLLEDFANGGDKLIKLIDNKPIS